METYDHYPETILNDNVMMSSNVNQSSARNSTAHSLRLKEENLEYVEYASNRAREPSSKDSLNTDYIIEEQLDPLSEKNEQRSEKDTSRKRKVKSESENKDDLLQKRLHSMEENLKSTIKKRIKKLGKKIMELQKSMLNDIMFLHKEQSGANVETGQSTNILSEAPISSFEKFSDFEQKLKCDAKLQNNLISLFLAINCTSPGEFLRICWSKILTDEVAANFSWSVTSTKNSICNRLITKTIKKAFALKFPLNQEKFNTVTQKYFQYAKERSTKLDPNADMTIGEPVVSDASNLINTFKETQPSTSTKGDDVEITELWNSSATGEIPKTSSIVSSSLILESSPNSSDNVQTYRNRNKTGQLKNPPKSSAQRSREYRLRKKRSKFLLDRQNQSQSNDSSTSAQFFEDNVDTTTSECLPETNPFPSFKNIPKKTTKSKEFYHKTESNIMMPKVIATITAPDRINTKIDINNYGFANASNCNQSSHNGDVTTEEYAAILYDDSFWKSDNVEQQEIHGNGNRNGNGNENGIQQSKPTPKTPAERSRAYRIRKRIQIAAALQRQQLENECFSNTDPLSQDSINTY